MLLNIQLNTFKDSEAQLQVKQNIITLLNSFELNNPLNSSTTQQREQYFKDNTYNQNLKS